jgi:hypothetical protein
MKDALKFTGKVVLMMLSCFLVAKLMMAFGLMVLACFFAVAYGCVVPVFFNEYRISGASLILGIFFIIFCGMVPAIQTDYKGFGTSRENVALEDAHNYSMTTLLTFKDAHVEGKLYGFEVLMGKYSVVGKLYAAPVVPSNWKPGMPIYVWALAPYRAKEEWKSDFRAGVRRLETDDAVNAMKDAVRSNGLNAASDPVFIEWCDRPWEDFKSEWLGGILLNVFLMAVWSIITLASFNYDLPKEKPVSEKEKEVLQRSTTLDQKGKILEKIPAIKMLAEKKRKKKHRGGH